MPSKNLPGRPDLSVVILSFNTKKITDECLTRVERAAAEAKKSRLKVETIVVENGSIDRSAEMILKKYPWVKLVRPGRNAGFAAGNNLGMKAARGKYILLINTDTFLEKETLEEAVSYMTRYPER